MIKRLESLLAVAAVVGLVASCSSSGGTSSPGGSGGSAMKIGVVTDVGRVDDKTFNQYAYEGAKAAATKLGGTINYVSPKDASDYTKDIQGFVDQKYNVIVTVGFNLGNATITAAKNNPDIWFIAVDVKPCVDPSGNPDAKFECKGDAATLLPKLIGLQFQEDQAGYLAGMVAAAVTKAGKVGQIGGVSSNPAVVRYLQGYELGAKAYKPDVQVITKFFSTGDLTKAYGDSTWGKTFTSQFIPQQGVDVVFQVAGATGNGALDAACAANIWAIGVDTDEFLSYPTASKCIITSAQKNVATAVQQTIEKINAGQAKGGVALFNAANDGVGYAPLNENKNVTFPSDLQGKLDKALAGMKDGSLKTCPDKCGTWTGGQ